MGTRKVLELADAGSVYSVIKKYGDVNPYRIYYHSYSIENGKYKRHKKLMAKYANMESCLYWFLQNVNLTEANV